MLFYCIRIFVIIIGCTNILYDKFTFLIFQNKEMRSSGSSKFFIYFLLFIYQVRKCVIFLFCSFFHVFEGIVRVHFSVIWLNCNYRISLFIKFFIKPYYPVFPCLGIRTVIASKYDNNSLFIFII